MKASKQIQCAVCGQELAQEADLTIQEAEYVFCRSCNHLNGIHENEDVFEAVFDEYDSTSSVDLMYSSKLEFLKESLPRHPTGILDVGCGTGGFVYTAQQYGYPALGIDLDAHKVNEGNKQIKRLSGCEPLHHVSEDELFEAVRYTAFDVISAIGVLQNLNEPNRFFEAVKKSRVSYLYYSVPMFSLSTILANSMPQYTSLVGQANYFTDQSLNRMHNLIGGECIAERRSGEDISGLQKAVFKGLQNSNGSDYAKERISERFDHILEQLQSTLNQNNFCSEIRMLISCSNSRFK